MVSSLNLKAIIVLDMCGYCVASSQARNHIWKILETFTVTDLARHLANKLFQNSDVNKVWYRGRWGCSRNISYVLLTLHSGLISTFYVLSDKGWVRNDLKARIVNCILEVNSSNSSKTLRKLKKNPNWRNIKYSCIKFSTYLKYALKEN